MKRTCPNCEETIELPDRMKEKNFLCPGCGERVPSSSRLERTWRLAKSRFSSGMQFLKGLLQNHPVKFTAGVLFLLTTGVFFVVISGDEAERKEQKRDQQEQVRKTEEKNPGRSRKQETISFYGVEVKKNRLSPAIQQTVASLGKQVDPEEVRRFQSTLNTPDAVPVLKKLIRTRNFYVRSEIARVMDQLNIPGSEKKNILRTLLDDPSVYVRNLAAISTGESHDLDPDTRVELIRNAVSNQQLEDLRRGGFIGLREIGDPAKNVLTSLNESDELSKLEIRAFLLSRIENRKKTRLKRWLLYQERENVKNLLSELIRYTNTSDHARLFVKKILAERVQLVPNSLRRAKIASISSEGSLKQGLRDAFKAIADKRRRQLKKWTIQRILRFRRSWIPDLVMESMENDAVPLESSLVMLQVTRERSEKLNEALLSLLTHRNSTVRKHAARALKSGRSFPEHRLRELLGHELAGVRNLALDILAERSSADQLKNQLFKLYRTNSPSNQVRVLRMLASLPRITKEDQHRLLASYEQKHPAGKKELLRTLRLNGKPSETVRQFLLDQFFHGGKELTRAAGKTIGSFEDDPRIVLDRIVSRLNSSSSDQSLTMAKASELVSYLGESAVAPLTSYVEASEENIRRWSVRTAGKHLRKTGIPVLENALLSQDAHIVANAVNHLLRLEAFPKHPPDHVYTLLNRKEKELLAAGLKALLAHGRIPKSFAPRVVELMSHEDTEIRILAKKLVAEQENPEQNALQTLLQHLEGNLPGQSDILPKNEIVPTVRALRPFGANAQPAIPALLKLLDYDDGRIRPNVVSVLGEIGGGRARVRKKLLTMLNSPYEGIRARTIRALGKVGDLRLSSVKRMIEVAEEGRNLGEDLAVALTDLKQMPVGAIELFLDQLNNGSEPVRNVLREIRDKRKLRSVLPKLVKTFPSCTSGSANDGENSCHLLKNLLLRAGEPAVPFLLKRIMHRDVRRNYKAMIGMLDLLIKLDVGPGQFTETMRIKPLKKALQRTEHRFDRQPTIPFVRSLFNLERPEAKRMAARILLHTNPPVSPAVPKLIKMLETGDPDLQKEAAYVLGQIPLNRGLRRKAIRALSDRHDAPQREVKLWVRWAHLRLEPDHEPVRRKLKDLLLKPTLRENKQNWIELKEDLLKVEPGKSWFLKALKHPDRPTNTYGYQLVKIACALRNIKPDHVPWYFDLQTAYGGCSPQPMVSPRSLYTEWRHEILTVTLFLKPFRRDELTNWAETLFPTNKRLRRKFILNYREEDIVEWNQKKLNLENEIWDDQKEVRTTALRFYGQAHGHKKSFRAYLNVLQNNEQIDLDLHYVAREVLDSLRNQKND